MGDLSPLLALAGVWVVVVLLPGPDFVVTVHYTTARSRRAGMGVAAGIVAATGVWAMGALVGLGLAIDHARWAIEAVRFGGAGFLVCLGIRTFLHAEHIVCPRAVAATARTVAHRVPN